MQIIFFFKTKSWSPRNTVLLCISSVKKKQITCPKKGEPWGLSQETNHQALFGWLAAARAGLYSVQSLTGWSYPKIATADSLSPHKKQALAGPQPASRTGPIAEVHPGLREMYTTVFYSSTSTSILVLVLVFYNSRMLICFVRDESHATTSVQSSCLNRIQFSPVSPFQLLNCDWHGGRVSSVSRRDISSRVNAAASSCHLPSRRGRLPPGCSRQCGRFWARPYPAGSQWRRPHSRRLASAAKVITSFTMFSEALKEPFFSELGQKGIRSTPSEDCHSVGKCMRW